jgi:hypothetical protein
MKAMTEGRAQRMNYDLFPDTADPVVGIRIKTDVPSCSCGSHLVIAGQGRAMHKASLTCCLCGKHCGWMSHETRAFVSEVIRLHGRLDAPVLARKSIGTGGGT